VLHEDGLLPRYRFDLKLIRRYPDSTVDVRFGLVLGAIVMLPMTGGAQTHAVSPVLSVGAVRALVISPHPDDATLAAGGLMQRILQRGGSVRVVQMTGGDAFPNGVVTLSPRMQLNPSAYRWYGSVREREAIRAMHRLGIGRSHVRLLGYPDEGLCWIAGAERAGLPFVSPYTAREAPPSSQQLIRGAMYRREDLVHELSTLMTALRPNMIVMPHCGDQHPDHCATHLLVHEALREALEGGLRPPRLLHFILHYPDWPAVKDPGAALAVPSAGQAGNWAWSTLPLTASERAAKSHALDAYRSQVMVMADFFKAFERSNELCVEGDSQAPFPCWCNGRNISAVAGGGNDR
jgi:LmbE family N-acetylglucosaminyl deacetylase